MSTAPDLPYFSVDSGNTEFWGLYGYQDFSANNDGSDRKIYPQTGWVQDYVDIKTKTKTEIDTLITSNSLVKGATYKITDCQTSLSGGTTLYLRA